MVTNRAELQIHAMTGTTARYDTVILGLGQTGLSCVRYFARAGVSIAVTDSRVAPPELATLQREYPGIPVFTGGFDRGLLAGARQLVVSPGVPLDLPEIRAAADRGTAVIGDVEIFCRRIRTPVIAVTGSNGKSTVATLVHEMFKTAGRRSTLAGNIGTPVLDVVDAPAPEFYVLELSSFQLESTASLNAAAAVVLNVSEDHMDRYHSIDAYAAAKVRIHAGDGTMVINLDDGYSRTLRRPGRHCIAYSLAEPAGSDFGIRTAAGVRWLVRGGERLLPVSGVRLRGEHNLSNSLGALALGSAVGLDLAPMLDTLRGFSGLPHRCQLIADSGGVQWYDDSKGTNVGASCSAIHGLGGDHNLILIAGGIGKGADFSPLAPAARGRLRAAILIGRDAPAIARVLEGMVPVSFATSMEAAVQGAARIARAGDRVLLSPACASFDMFADYQARGRAFVRAVTALLEPPA